MTRSGMPALPGLASTPLAAAGPLRHAFYGRRGGVSAGVFASLNCSRWCGDAGVSVDANLGRVAADLGGARIFTNRQVHGRRVREITAAADPGEVFEGDGLVTGEAGLGLGVLAADCAPVLFADPVSGVIGAAHAGWRGALAGVTDAVVAEMARLGARPQRIICAIGPAIQFHSYRVGARWAGRFRAASPFPCDDCFRGNAAGDTCHFDLPGYLRMRLARAGVGAIDTLADDTFADPAQFFSHRRSTHHGEAGCGRHISVIALR